MLTPEHAAATAPTPIEVRVFYPADPNGVVAGGVDTFLRGLVKWAPPSLQFSVVGMTTDPVARPVGRWTTCDLGRRTYAFYPVIEVADAARRTRVPLSVRYVTALVRQRSRLKSGFDILDFHRIEPVLAFLRDPRPKNAFFHQDMGVIRSEGKADILWRHLPGLYFGLESMVVDHLAAAWCVREEGAHALQSRNPRNAAAIRFVPTWVDTEIFCAPTAPQRADARASLATSCGWPASGAWIVTVGRLDTQKDPALMLAAFAEVVAAGEDVRWIVVGDGVLRSTLEQQVSQKGLADRVRFVGLRTPSEIGRILQACDVYALSSAYEGMPMALLEALASGLPVASTRVGEVQRVVFPGLNGALAEPGDLRSFTTALSEVVRSCARLGGAAAVSAIARFTPADVLAPVYASYLSLGQAWRSGLSADAGQAHA